MSWCFLTTLIYNKNAEEHQQHLTIVLELLASHQLYANAKKCDFGQQSVAYLGHIISADGVSVDKSKVQSMLEWSIPVNIIRELRGFLGLTGYYRKFIAGYAKIAQPLTEQLKKDNFNWNESATTTFRTLQ